MRTMFRLIVAAATLAPCAAAQEIQNFEFEVETLSGQALRHTDFSKSVLLVDYWGTWCPPCRDAVPVLQELYAKYKHHGLEIVGLTYEGAAKDAADKVRKFAATHGITYHLAMGTPALKRIVKDFRAFPTLLHFKRGLQFDHLSVGFKDADALTIENWVRGELGLEPIEGEDAAEEEIVEEEEEEVVEEVEELDLPKGVVFQPGDGDKGFDFEVEDVDGKSLKFKDMRGKPVLVALTSTWDASSTTTAKMLSALHGKHGESAHVVAASLELRGSRERKVGKIKKFREEHKLEYPLFPAGIGFQKKVHLFSGMPLFLVFDADGVLILRESGYDPDAGEGKELDATREKIAQSLGN